MSSNLTVEKKEKEDGTVHSYTQEEKVAIVEHINGLLLNDPHVSPVDPFNDDIFEAVRDGVLVCKLLNAVVPGTMTAGLINTKTNKNRYEIAENHVAALRFAKQIGIHVVNIGAMDIMEGKAHLILGLLWQLVRVGSIAKGHQLDFMGMDEDLIPEDILLRWVNHHLKNANHPRTVSNFGSDIKVAELSFISIVLQDSECYTVLLNQLSPEACSLAPLEEKDLSKRARLFLEGAERVKCKKFINATDIIKGNTRLNTAFVANLFYVFNKFEEAQVETEEIPEIEIDTIEAEDDIALLEREIQRIQKALREQEEEDAVKVLNTDLACLSNLQADIMLEAEKVLEQKAEKLKEELERERRKGEMFKKQQDGEVDSLKAKLRQLQAENNSTETEQDILNRISHEEQERIRVSENQRLLETEMDDLREQLEERTEERIALENKKKRVEEETRKMQLRHKNQLETLKSRLIRAKEEESQKRDELENEIQTKEMVEEDIFQNQRKQTILTKTLQKEIDHKRRIEDTKKKLQDELKKAQNSLEIEKEKQNIEARKKSKLTARITRATKQGEELQVTKTDILIKKTVLGEEVEEMKDLLLDEETKKRYEKMAHDKAVDEVDELQEELEDIEDAKHRDIKRLVKTQKYEIEKLQRTMETDKRKAAAPGKKMEAEAQAISLDILEEESHVEELKLKNEFIQEQSKELGKRLMEESTTQFEMKEDNKLLERGIAKQNSALTNEKILKKTQQAEKQKLKGAVKKLRGEVVEEASARAAIERDAATLERVVEAGLASLDQSESQAKAARLQAKRAEKEYHEYEREVKEESQRTERSIREAQSIKLKEKEKAEKAQERARLLAKRDGDRLKQSELELTEQADKELAEKLQLEATMIKRTKEVSLLEKSLADKQSDISEAEKAKRKLEKDLRKAEVFFFEDQVKRDKEREARRAEKKIKKSAEKTRESQEKRSVLEGEAQSLAAKIESTKTELENKGREKKSFEEQKNAFEAELATLSAELKAGVDEKKSKARQKAKASKDELMKKAKRDKEKAEREAKRLLDQKAQLEARQLALKT